MKSVTKKSAVAVVLALLVGGAGWLIWSRLPGPPAGRGGGPAAAPVEAAVVQRRGVEEVRTFSGTLVTPAQVRVAAKVGGRVEALAADFADAVERGQIVARLDEAEYAADLAAAEADLSVARANQTEAKSAYEIAGRELGRVRTLQERGVSSEAQYDTVRAAEQSADARVAVAGAQVAKAQAALDSARVRLGYATVRADWTDGPGGPRVVAERFVEEGDTVAANTPLFSIVVLDPLRAVVFVAERDYARLERGQEVTLSSDAYPGRTFPATVDRVSPVFEEGSRQARVELTVPNAERLLRPGLFVRARTVLGRAEDALVVPQTALTRRGGGEAVFVLRAGDGGGLTAALVPVTPGIREGEDVQLVEAVDISAGDRVVTLGQQLLDDGSPAVVPDAGDAGKDRP